MTKKELVSLLRDHYFQSKETAEAWAKLFCSYNNIRKLRTADFEFDLNGDLLEIKLNGKLIEEFNIQSEV